MDHHLFAKPNCISGTIEAVYLRIFEPSGRDATCASKNTNNLDWIYLKSIRVHWIPLTNTHTHTRTLTHLPSDSKNNSTNSEAAFQKIEKQIYIILYHLTTFPILSNFSATMVYWFLFISLKLICPRPVMSLKWVYIGCISIQILLLVIYREKFVHLT